MAYVSAAGLSGTEAQGNPLEERSTVGTTVQLPHKPTLREYEFYANLKREAERNGTSGNGVDADGHMITRPSILTVIRSKGHIQEAKEKNEKSAFGTTDVTITEIRELHNKETEGLSEDEIDRLNSRRMLRVAGWSMIFYLMTTDILGPFNAPYAIANLGIVPGVLLYFFFGIFAFIFGWVISFLYNRLDSDRYPVRTYGDLCERLGGIWLRHACSILQSIQLIVNVGIICLSSGQSLYQVSKGKLCFSVCVLIWALIGMIGGQIRSFKNFAILGSSAVYLNLLVIFISMGVVAHSLPNYAAANAANPALGTGPVVVQAFNSQDLVGEVNGLFNMVFAYGGAMIFPELIAEMRRPMDFIKGMACAQLLIFTVYLTYGVFWYCFQGQYTQAQSFQGLSPYTWQTICNVLNMIAAMIAAMLYGNVGIKVIYINIIEDMLKGPKLNSKKGRIIWTLLVPVYWSIAFIIGSSVPALGAMTGLIGAAAIFHFTYTFPPLLLFMYLLKHDASHLDTNYEGFGTQTSQIDTFKQTSRWRRGLFTGNLKRDFLKIVLFFTVLAALACDGLGLWGTGEAVKQALSAGAATSFGCSANA